VADDRVAAAVAELYGADPDAFTERRKALAATAREAGDKQSAAAITALRKPTRAAWVVNQLARADPDAAVRMAALAADLRAAEQAGDGRRLRELSAERGSLLDGLVAQALAAAGTPDPPPTLRAEVTDTLTAALADPATAADFAAGRLTKAAQWGGFGYAGFGVADDSAVDTPVPSRTSGTRAPIPLPRQAGRAKQAEPSGRAKLADTPATSLAGKRQAREQRERELREEREQQRRAEEEQRRAQEAAERAALAREKFEDAERSLAQTSATAAEAVAAEDRLEAEVRQLEERITQAREELATARLRARRAEAAERRARQARDRLL
jgi:hypothetical protein